MNYVIGAVVVKCAYKISSEYIKHKTLYYSWYVIKFPFVYTYNKVFKTNTDQKIDEDYDLADD